MPSSRLRLILALALLLPLTGCLFRTRRVERIATPAVIQDATQQELVARINDAAAKIQTVNATVDIDTDVGGPKKGKTTEYQQIRGYILVNKPATLRMIGLFPLVRNRAFDMVSDGQTFKLWIPVKNKFYIGRNDVIHPSKQPLENLRPQHIFDALLLRAVDPENEVAVMESTSERLPDLKTRKQVEQPEYTVVVVRRSGSGWFLSRKVIFSRTDLLPHRQIVYDKLGNVATDAHYEGFKDFNGTHFPSQITITRPQEEYSITLSMVKLTVNQPLTSDQFELPEPPGAQVVSLDTPQEQRAADGNPSAPK
jgi:outer membrane lipoprotein-sorting protein